MDNLKNLFYIIPVMLYYFVESMIISIFVSIVWRLLLAPGLDFYIGYFQWVAMIWIVKVVFFDVFKLIGGIMVMPPQNENNDDTKHV